jgi:hypothetical protein
MKIEKSGPLATKGFIFGLAIGLTFGNIAGAITGDYNFWRIIGLIPGFTIGPLIGAILDKRRSKREIP